MTKMTSKQRELIYEAFAIGLAGMFGAFAVPELLSVRNSVAVLAGGVLTLGWLCWFGYFLYRLNTMKG